MSRVNFLLATALAMLILFVPQLVATGQVSQPLLQGFGQSFEAVLRAESAGATSQELSPLVAQLNKALELDRQALTLTNPTESGQRVELFAQVNQILARVHGEADQLADASAQRSYDDRILNYTWGMAAAVLGTLGYALALPFYDNLRIKRTFRMKVRRK